jgi:Sortase domain
VKRVFLAGAAAAAVMTVATAAGVSDPGVPAGSVSEPHHLVAAVQHSEAPAPHSDALVIPALGVRAPLVATGAVGPPGAATLTIPSNIHTVAWWDGAPRPGQPGVALIAGHVDSAAAGPGALYDLARIRVGSTVRVTLRGLTTTWRVVRAPELTPKTALPRALFRAGGPPRLALVTCGGGFDAATGHYLDNVIVWAVPVRRV